MIDSNEFQSLLLQEKERLEETLTRFGAKDPAHPSNWEPKYPDLNPGETDAEEGADETEQFDATIGIETRLEEQLREVTAALERIKNGVYGMCENDGKEIPLERLRAVPTARTCLLHP